MAQVPDRHPPEGADGGPTQRLAASPAPLGRITAAHFQRLDQTRRPAPNRPLRRLGSYALVFLLAGEGHYQDETGVDVPLHAGDLILIMPEVGHRYGPRHGAVWVERYVVFEGPIFSLWEASGLLDMRPPIVRLEPIHAWNAEFDILFGHTGRSGALPALEEVCRLQHLLARILSVTRERSDMSTTDHTWLSTALALLDADEHDDLDLIAVAESMSLSYDGFRKRFRRLAGISPARYRAERTIDRARHLIQLGELTGAQIAEMLGFYDEQHFSRRFKQVVGKSPRDFRASLPRSTLPEW
jgi:AraC-like DNA-binding protein